MYDSTATEYYWMHDANDIYKTGKDWAKAYKSRRSMKMDDPYNECRYVNFEFVGKNLQGPLSKHYTPPVCTSDDIKVLEVIESCTKVQNEHLANCVFSL